MKRKIIRIDEEKCTGCGDCIPNCPEGAIQIIDSKARLISDLFCDGLGACLGHCPEGAITIEEREAEPYDERKVMENVIRGGLNVVRAHLEHLREHGETELLREAVKVLTERGFAQPGSNGLTQLSPAAPRQTGCPGSQSMSFGGGAARGIPASVDRRDDPAAPSTPSELTHWPIQLHLISPQAGHFRSSHLLLAADCVAFSLSDFHANYLRGRKLAIACPKLDDGQEVYVEKIQSLIEDAGVKSIEVMIMQVPCCGGLVRLVQRALESSGRKVPAKFQVVGIQGNILRRGEIRPGA
jgi:ferredoxin